MKPFLHLKTKILFLFGSLIIVLMLLISVTSLYQWRRLILKDRMENAESIAQSFSFSVLDALIYRENNLQISEGYLQSYILNYARKNPRIRYISISTIQGKLIAHSDIRALRHNTYPRPQSTGNGQAVSRIFKHPQLGWLVETDYPLQTGQRNWGVLQMAFDAEPIRLSIQKLVVLLTVLTLLSVAIVLGMLYFFADRLTASLSGLVTRMDRFDLQNEHEPDKEIVYSHDEIGYLNQQFEKMKSRLNSSRDKLIFAERQIYRAEKLASVGRLASGVAHEINNPLNGIKNCVYVLQQKTDKSQNDEKYLNLIDEGLTHIEVIVKKLLNFSHQSDTRLKRVDLNREIELVTTLLDYRLREKQIQLLKFLQSDLPKIQADAQLIQEVLMNLLINALDAVREEGTIRIQTESWSQQRIRLSIADNGSGISADITDKIFDPFFTTKEEGKGTGLGLSVSLGIVEAHNGEISVSSRDGFTVFEVTLPVEQGG